MRRQDEGQGSPQLSERPGGLRPFDRTQREIGAGTWTLVTCSGGVRHMVETPSDAVCVVNVVGSQAIDSVQAA